MYSVIKYCQNPLRIEQLFSNINRKGRYVDRFMAETIFAAMDQKRGASERKRSGSRLKGMPQKDLINIRNYDVRYLIPKVCSAVLKNGAEILIESTVK